MINNKKRELLKSMALFSSAALISSCTEKAEVPNLSDNKFPKVKLRMVTSFPRNLPGADIPAQILAKRIKNISQGKIDITHYAAGELVPAFEVFDAERAGSFLVSPLPNRVL